MTDVERGAEAFLIKQNKALRSAGCNLAIAAIRVIESYDGLHRLSLAVSKWAETLANEGGRSQQPKELESEDDRSQ